jgi:hypothetical protein
MIRSGVNKLQNYFSQGHTRTVQAKINITGGFLLKGLGVLLSMLIVRRIFAERVRGTIEYAYCTHDY